MARVRRRSGVRAFLPVVVVSVGAGLLHGGAALAQEAEPSPDLAIAGTSSAPPGVRPGDVFSYELVVTNQGDARAHGVSVVARMPRGMRVVNLLPTIDGGRCSVAGVGERLRFVVVCERAALGPGGWATVGIDVQAVVAHACRSLRMRARAEARNEPIDLVDRANTVTLEDRTACLEVSLRVSAPRFAHSGDRVTLWFRVTNLGETDLSAIVVSDRACDAPPRRRPNAGQGSLSPGHAREYTCMATMGRAGTHHQVARVRARGRGGTDVRASETYAIDVLRPSLLIELLRSPADGPPGSVLSQRYRVTNTGDTDLHHVVVRIDGAGLVGRVGRLTPRDSAVIRASLPVPGGTARATWIATAVGHDRLGLAVSDTAHSSVRIAPAHREPGTAFTGPPDPVALGGLAVALGLVGAVASRVGRVRREITPSGA